MTTTQSETNKNKSEKGRPSSPEFKAGFNDGFPAGYKEGMEYERGFAGGYAKGFQKGLEMAEKKRAKEIEAAQAAGG